MSGAIRGGGAVEVDPEHAAVGEIQEDQVDGELSLGHVGEPLLPAHSKPRRGSALEPAQAPCGRRPH